MRVKLRVPEEKENGITYQVPARIVMECIYIGESKGTLMVRLMEHKCAVVRSNVKNGVPVHVAKNEHSID